MLLEYPSSVASCGLDLRGEGGSELPTQAHTLPPHLLLLLCCLQAMFRAASALLDELSCHIKLLGTPERAQVGGGEGP